MVQTLAYCFGKVAPYYNLGLVVLVIILFLTLFRKYKKSKYVKPWKLLFVAVLVYVAEEVATVIDMGSAINVPNLLFPILEMIIITIFIYVVLLGRELTKK
jgi:ABC-type iron transport system FetAB permease component